MGNVQFQNEPNRKSKALDNKINLGKYNGITFIVAWKNPQ